MTGGLEGAGWVDPVDAGLPRGLLSPPRGQQKIFRLKGVNHTGSPRDYFTAKGDNLFSADEDSVELKVLHTDK